MDSPDLQPFFCPECGLPLIPPRKLWFGPGEYEIACPNGHLVLVANVVRYEDDD